VGQSWSKSIGPKLEGGGEVRPPDVDKPRNNSEKSMFMCVVKHTPRKIIRLLGQNRLLTITGKKTWVVPRVV